MAPAAATGQSARLAAALTACLAALLVAVPAAGAATASLAYDEEIPGVAPAAYTLIVRAGPGEANRLHIAGEGTLFDVRDGGVPIEAGRGCESVTANWVRCRTSQAHQQQNAFVDAGDRGDQVVIGPMPGPIGTELRGGTGDDLLQGGPGDDLLFGGTGDDTIAGVAGNDRIDGARGSDAIDGGADRDRVLYESRRRPLRIDLAAGTGGERGERDTLAGIEDVWGGWGADTIAGDAIGNKLVGGPGRARDRIVGRGGNDGPTGHYVQGGTGDDFVDGQVNRCGPGADSIFRLTFKPRGPFHRSCETVVAAFSVTIAPNPVRSTRRRLYYSYRCFSGAGVCRGTIELRDSEGLLAKRRHATRHGTDPSRMRRLRVRLRRRPAERVVQVHVQSGESGARDWFLSRVR